jgi:hypothetical protein
MDGLSPKDVNYIRTWADRVEKGYPYTYNECKILGHDFKPYRRMFWRLYGLRFWRARRWTKCAGCGIVQMGPKIFGRRP